ncbi:ATP-binding cassette sub-family F member 3-like [Eriocheir sinensis]|uniref:ATP-binding cassette sub-family F member 3-like n=1 Tax=Eriocheir sinensis TaxID=95602 RepID=UPI0021C97DB0|nr:ATP-binding cassette sub-family F member 3-like [Eriocheir sinensis]
MAAPSQLVRDSFPDIDEEIFQYVEGVLASTEDFETSDDVYEAIGGLLVDAVGLEKDGEIRRLCGEVMELLSTPNGALEHKTLEAPVQLAQMAANMELEEHEIKSVWSRERDDALKVDQRKLDKAEAKLKEKKEKRINTDKKDVPAPIILEMATASQIVSKKDRALDAKGICNTKDIRIESFDVAYGDRVLIQNATISLAFGRRYALVGRNGLGKTTLLRMMASRSLRIPSHISILYVEQEVTGDDTTALESVLECDIQRKTLLDREKEIQSRIAQGEQDDSLATQLSEVYAELQAIEADKAPAKASVILNGLGFNPEMQTRRTKEFSGGWRMRIALARALFSQPDLLLLDEPTNMLDMKAIIWLENYLMGWSSTLLVVSHDRHFLDIVPTDVLHLHSQDIDMYRGNYENFIQTKSERQKNQQREYDAQMQFRAHVQEFIDKFRYNAKRASLVQSKIKMLEKLPELKPIEKEVGVVLRFPEVEKLNNPILQLDEVQFEYTAGNTIFTAVNLSAAMDSRICIVGENGTGKTTLLKILLGELEPTKGHRLANRSLRIGYFTQHHVDQLDMRVCPVELLQSKYSGRPIEEYRRQLGSFGVSGDLALQQLASLSGGQKSRVAFSLMCMGNPNFFILDEPTNHLDIETIESLGEAISRFKGGVVLVSHDERLIRMVCTELWVCGEKKVRCVEGGFDEYRALVEKEIQATL